jgi:hypothetical protein
MGEQLPKKKANPRGRSHGKDTMRTLPRRMKPIEGTIPKNNKEPKPRALPPNPRAQTVIAGSLRRDATRIPRTLWATRTRTKASARLRVSIFKNNNMEEWRFSCGGIF